MRVAVVGCGMGGAALAGMLASVGNDVTVFEQAPRCGPVGAGILLQPSGQQVLADLGILGEVRQRGTAITGLDARHRSGRRLTTLDYAVVSDRLTGIGVLRGELFSILHDRCVRAGVTIVEGSRVSSYAQDADGVEPFADDHGSLGRFDLLVAADGARSTLRAHSEVATRQRIYPWAAMWMSAPFSGDESRLVQMVDQTGRLVGILPVGRRRCSFFWGIDTVEQTPILDAGIEAWRDQVHAFDAEAGAIADSISSFDEVTFSGYRTVRMSTPIDGRVVFIGDAAHATSPHLGQGLNLALVDAAVLADELQSAPVGADRVPAALAAYRDRRGSTIRYYTQVTGALTPFFQTSNRVLRLARDLALPVMPRIPVLRSHMVMTMAGLEESWARPLASRRRARKRADSLAISPDDAARRR